MSAAERRDLQERAILHVLAKAERPLSSSEIKRRGGDVPPLNFDGRLQRLKAKGLIRCEGRTSGARWALADSVPRQLRLTFQGWLPGVPLPSREPEPCAYCDRRAYVHVGPSHEPRCDWHASAGAAGRLPPDLRRACQAHRKGRSE